MTLKKTTGSFYTPESIAKFIVMQALDSSIKSDLKIIEPSAGDGIFVKAISESTNIQNISLSVIAIEISKSESEKIHALMSPDMLTVINDDFLEAQASNNLEKADLVIGNPPYIRRIHLTDSQKKRCSEIHSIYPQLSKFSVKNIWSAFLVRAISLVKNDGTLAFILPAEILQIKYASELRDLLLTEFQRLEIYTFNELVFKECKGQDTIILIARKKSDSPGLFFSTMERSGQDFNNGATTKFLLPKSSTQFKWTSHILTHAEVKFIELLSSQTQTVNDLSISRPGIVTAANHYFIVNSTNLARLSLEKYAKPIILKPSIIKENIIFNDQDFNNLSDSGTNCFLLDFESAETSEDNALKAYILHGLNQGINSGFKLRKRKVWFKVPNIGAPAAALFFRRCHEAPKFVKNVAGALATDNAYYVSPRHDFDINSIIFSYYNSLTIILSELRGRNYGGGVLELTPQEFKGLPIPYTKISERDFSFFCTAFSSKKSFDEFLSNQDKVILKKAFPSITNAEINTLKNIRQKLLAHRQRFQPTQC